MSAEKRTAAKVTAVFATSVAIVVLSWWLLVVHDRSIRTRLTLTIATPEGVRTGSSVTQQTITFGPFQLKTGSSSWSIGSKMIGEGLVVDLGQRGLLVSTLVAPDWLKRGNGYADPGLGGYAGGLPFSEAEYKGTPSAEASSAEKHMAYLDELNRVKPTADIPVKDIPVLVKFSNPSDPTSVSLVDPSNLEAAFGSGVTLKAATVEITGDPVSNSIDTRLPWLKPRKDPKFDEADPWLIPRPPPWSQEQRPNFDLSYRAFKK